MKKIALLGFLILLLLCFTACSKKEDTSTTSIITEDSESTTESDDISDAIPDSEVSSDLNATEEVSDETPVAAPSESVILQSTEGSDIGIYEYDANGNNIKIIYYNSIDDSLLSYDTFTYDEANRLIEHIEYESDDTPYERDTYEYNEDGTLYRETSEYYYSSEETKEYRIWSIYEYQYDETGLLVQCYELDDEDVTDINVYHNYIYDENQHLTRIEHYDYDNDQLQLYITVTCNEDGSPIKEEWFLTDESVPMETNTYAYNEDGQLIQCNDISYEYGPMPQ